MLYQTKLDTTKSPSQNSCDRFTTFSTLFYEEDAMITVGPKSAQNQSNGFRYYITCNYFVTPIKPCRNNVIL